MKTIILAVLLLVFTVSAQAEDSVNVKLGVADIICEGVNTSPIVALSYEHAEQLNKLPKVAIEIGIKGYSMKLHDTQVEHQWLKGKEMGILNTLAYFSTFKIYPLDNFYIGIGIDYLDNYFSEDSRIYSQGYIINADVDDEVGGHITVGIELINDFYLEGEYLIADLDIESNVFPEGVLEARSRFNNYAFMIVRKIRF